jgi:LPS-assembly protein
MKNKLIKFICFFLSICNFALADAFQFEVSNIDILNKGNQIIAINGKAISSDKNLEIDGKRFQYDKNINILNVVNGDAIIKSNNLEIKFDELIINEKNLLITAKGNVKILDFNNELTIESENIIFDRKKNILKSSSKSILIDKFNNIFRSDKFEYQINNDVIKIENLFLSDFNDNNFKINLAYLNTNTNKLSGKDIAIDLKNIFFEKDNEPRLKGSSIIYANGNTEISKGVFTPCKKTDKCPPWQLNAKKITHNKKKKNIQYEDVWLKIYDVPVVYFPKFFHPDPTVKRQSGLLMPTFKNSPNGNSYFSVPYFKVLSDNKDLTFTPRLYAKDQFLFQTEFRKENKRSKMISDVSIYAEKDKSLKSHIFYNFDKKFNYLNFKDSDLSLKIQQTTNDTYIKGNKITSPIISNNDLMENSLALKLQSDNLLIESDITMYENLNIKSSDRYEYIFPKIDITKQIKNKTKLDGNFVFESSNYIHNYQTNILKKKNTNDLTFASFPKINNFGFYNNYEFFIKNSNSDINNSPGSKDGADYYLSGLFQFNSSLPMVKKTSNYQSLLKPKVSLKLSPDNDKNISSQTDRLDVNNIFNLKRINSDETVEGGISLTYGNDFNITNIENSREILSVKFANNIRLKENEDLPKINQLSAKTSNFFGEISYNPNSFFTTKYNFSTKNNFYDINYENIEAKIKINNFVTKFDYLNENNSLEKNSYLLNQTSYEFDEHNNISFSTRHNKKINLTEYYNLIYQYKTDCLKASLEYNKDYYSDRDIKPDESIFFRLTFVPLGQTSSPNLKK